MSLTFTLVPKCSTDVKDAAGLWQIEGGNLLRDKEQVGTYSSVIREDCGTTELKTAMLWMTLFFLGKKPTPNMTLHGAHDLGGHNETGSVSAATLTYAPHIGHQFHRVLNTLTIS